MRHESIILKEAEANARGDHLRHGHRVLNVPQLGPLRMSSVDATLRASWACEPSGGQAYEWDYIAILGR